MTGASNTTYVVDTTCPPDGRPCTIGELDNYGQRTGFPWCHEHAEVVGTVTEAS